MSQVELSSAEQHISNPQNPFEEQWMLSKYVKKQPVNMTYYPTVNDTSKNTFKWDKFSI